MRIKNMIPAMLMAAVILTGCGAQQAQALDETGIILDKDRRVTQVIVESFDRSYYNADELRSQIEAKITQAAGDKDSPRVKLQKFELSEDGQLSVGIEFATGDDYASFNGKTLFTGTVDEAAAKGYTLTGLETTEGEAVDGVKLSADGDKQIVVFEEAMTVVVPGRVLYHSDNVTADGEKQVHKDTDSGNGIVVYE